MLQRLVLMVLVGLSCAHNHPHKHTPKHTLKHIKSTPPTITPRPTQSNITKLIKHTLSTTIQPLTTPQLKT